MNLSFGVMQNAHQEKHNFIGSNELKRDAGIYPVMCKN